MFVEHLEEFDDDFAVLIELDAEFLTFSLEERPVLRLPRLERPLTFGLCDVGPGLMEADPSDLGCPSKCVRCARAIADDGKLTHLWQAPFTLQPNVVAAIREEAEIARSGRKGRIIVKVNALLEPETIEALYEASQAGVEIDVIARSVCALKPGVPGLSDKIRVRSIVGRFLEHHRIFYFQADGADKLYLSSADWMERNFFKRIEVAFPILDPKLKKKS